MTEHAASTRPPNRLAQETSPYLLQHAHNPVDWYPWGAEALERAKAEDKPILLSVGYAACHWCHVMERESFEDEETAALMNEHFVPVKVDREERPDVDAIYMDAVQRISGHGGWPMTVFLTPDGRPFYAGTYYPPQDRHGLPSFKRVLASMAAAWREQRAQIDQVGHRVVADLRQLSGLRQSPDPLAEDVLMRAHAGLSRAHDPRWGGFGQAPKFPQPMTLEFLLRCHLRGYAGSLDMVRVALDRMADGGIHDQVGGGFHRYSTDGRWHVPHFEKMLYDNAQLARLYTHAWQVTAEPRYRRVAEGVLDYLLLEMCDAEGGFYSSQDADSEGVEGRFFVWSFDELVEIAGSRVATALGATPEGNWEGTNVLWFPRPVDGVAAELGVSPEALREEVDAAGPRLFERREGRVRPATDDKVLAGWNGLAISALARSGRAFDEPRYVRAAEEAARFVLTNLRRDDGRLLRSWRAGRASPVPAYAEDHAMIAEACLTLYETTFDLRWFGEAMSLTGDLVRLFADPDGGGFFQTGSDAEALVIRPKELFDNAVPSGNSVAAEVLQRLAALTGEPELERAGVSALRLVRDLMPRSPTGFGQALSGLDTYLSTVREVAIVGDPAAEDTRGLVREVHGRYLPNVVLAVASPADAEAAEAVGLLRDRPQMDGRATAYVCQRFVCRRPVTEPEALASELG